MALVVVVVVVVVVVGPPSSVSISTPSRYDVQTETAHDFPSTLSPRAASRSISVSPPAVSEGTPTLPLLSFCFSLALRGDPPVFSKPGSLAKENFAKVVVVAAS